MSDRPDRATPRDQLTGPYRAVSDVLDDYLVREYGRITSHNGWDLFLGLLAEQGYEVRPHLAPAEAGASCWSCHGSLSSAGLCSRCDIECPAPDPDEEYAHDLAALPAPDTDDGPDGLGWHDVDYEQWEVHREVTIGQVSATLRCEDGWHTTDMCDPAAFGRALLAASRGEGCSACGWRNGAHADGCAAVGPDEFVIEDGSRTMRPACADDYAPGTSGIGDAKGEEMSDLLTALRKSIEAAGGGTS